MHRGWTSFILFSFFLGLMLCDRGQSLTKLLIISKTGHLRTGEIYFCKLDVMDSLNSTQ